MNLLELLKDQVTDGLVSQASSFLGESGSGVSKAIEIIFPSLLVQLINRSQDTDGAQKVFDMAHGMDTDSLDNIFQNSLYTVSFSV